VTWIITALAASMVVSIGNMIDSHLLSKKMPSLTSFLIPTGLTQLVAACILLLVFPFSHNPGASHILAVIGAASLNGCVSIIIMNTLRKSEVSRVIPILCSAPIFVALLSIPVLGETMGYWQWLAVIMTVTGAILISLHFGQGGGKTRLHKSFFLLLLAALMSAVASIGFKYGMKTMPFWNAYGIAAMCMGTVMLIYALRKSNLLELKNLPQRTQKVGLIIGDQCIGILSAILAFRAMSLGPVSLVNALLNTRPVFVFIFSLVLTWLVPNFINESLNKRTAAIKFFAVILMTGGIVIISISK
jgi:uncharacterized membrane protein